MIGERLTPRRAGSLNLLMAVAALAGMTWSVFDGSPIRTLPIAGSDAKTLYASAWNLVRGQDAYSLPNLAHVFHVYGVAAPGSWNGYAPVYPPTTLALLGVLTFMPMVPATYLLIVLSAALMALALAELLRYATAAYGAGLGFRVVLLAACAASPLLGAALSAGNASVATAALCLLAFAGRKARSGWLCGAMLAAAVLLKPHIAVWVVLAMLLLPEREARRVGMRALSLAAAFAAVVVAVLACSGTLAMQLRGYGAILHAEMGSGASMHVGNRETLQVVSQVTSLHSLVGFWTASPTALIAIAVVLVVLLPLLVISSRGVRTEGGAALAVGAWCAFGMLATYHRAYDGMVLFCLLPWILWRLRRGTWEGWLVAVAYAAVSVAPGAVAMNGWFARYPGNSMLAFLLLRQAALATLCLVAVLLVAMGRERRALGSFASAK